MFKKLLVISLLTTLFTACSNDKNAALLPEDIVANAIEAYGKIDSYYVATEIFFYEDTEIVEDGNVKYWVSLENGKQRIRVERISNTGENVISTSDGEKFIMYDKESN